MDDDSIDRWVDKEWLKPKFPDNKCLQETFPSHTITFCTHYKSDGCKGMCEYAKRMEKHYGGKENGNKK